MVNTKLMETLNIKNKTPHSIEDESNYEWQFTLNSLIEEYQSCLLLCWKIRVGSERSIQIERIKNYVDWYYIRNLHLHFSILEDFIFPKIGCNNPVVKKALIAHRRLNKLFAEKDDLLESLSLIAKELEKHVCFERDNLFNEIQRLVPKRELYLIMKIHSETIIMEDWGDKFWK